MANLPKFALQRLHQKNAAVATHPDPNLISAFVENSLPREASAQMVQHLARCADCRELVFLSSPDQAATLPAMASAPSRWLTWPVLRWSAAVAAVVVVVAAVSLHRPSDGKLTPSSALQATNAPIAKQKVDAPPLLEEKREMAAIAKPASVAPAARNDSLRDADNKPLEQLKKQGSRGDGAAMLAQKSEIVSGKLAEQRPNRRPDQRNDELDKSQTVDVTASAAPVNNESNQVVPGRAKDSAAEPAANMRAGIGGGIAPAAALQARAASALPVIAPRWTLTSEGTLQRSLDFGRSWQTIPVASQASFRALAASGRDIWVGGAKGALYHSSNAGLNWTQVQPVAAGQTLADDIIGVEFPDPLHGKVTSSSKEIWTTEDGGQSWRKQ
jgi:hypothetical protein